MRRVIAVLGPTGAGKSLQAHLLAEHLKMTLISSGDLLRASTDPDIKHRMEAGDLVRSSDVEHLVEDAIRQAPKDKGIVLDGFPRRRTEQEWLNVILKQSGLNLSKVFLIEVPKEVSLDRLEERHRTDDEKEIIKHKWLEYIHTTSRVVEGYREAGILAKIDGTLTPEAVTAEIKKHL
ncbi:MAG TPA: nucleoside monophosphate kinase [Candidatus Dormibacteraeota bacterium]|nr:nucleoside monophosphate kinase [Candidatus Dormibacteraeota bacterium]